MISFHLFTSARTDYIPEEIQLTLLPGDFEKTVSISLVDDEITECQESFSLSLHSPVSNLRVELPNPTSSIFIIDDDRGQ